MFFLKAQWELLGLKAPVFSWVVSFGLIAYCIYVYLRFYKESRDQARIYSIAKGKLAALRHTASIGPGKGISRQFYDSIDEIFDGFPLLRASWLRISSFVVVRADKNGEDRFWITEEIGDFLNETSMVDSQSYKTAPTVISGVGLLATFLAILVALLDVRLTNNKVQGLDLLLQGLSGKFLSSVVAIGCATILIHAEKGVFRKARAGVTSLAATLTNLIPKLVPVQVLSDIHREVAEQASAFRIFDADFSLKLKRGLSENIEPAAGRVVSAVNDLGRYLKEADTEKRESMSSQIAALRRDLGQPLEKIAEQLNDSLAGSGQGQSGRISESMSETAMVLQQISSQLLLNQNAFNDLINSTRTAAVDDIAGRQAHIDQLTGAVNRLVVRLQEKTGESTALTERAMAAIIEETSERSADKLKEALDEAGSLNSRRGQQLAELLDKHGAELSRVEDLRLLLDDTLNGFVKATERFGQVTEGLQKLTSQMNISVACLNQIAKSVGQSQGAATRILASASGQIESLEKFILCQREVWDGIHTSMGQYEQVFERVEGHAKDLLAQVAQHLGGYSKTTQNHFVQLTSAADNLISQATGRLSVSIDELSEQLDVLHGVVADMAYGSQAAR
ncbi:MAG: hypothetical protein ABSD38_28255 [Syntrophorhabdales bacterium]|jgi:hypothetical protein